MQLNFSKMHGLGNDFVVIDAINQQIELTPEVVRFLADRHFGIGCDQLLLVEPSRLSETDFRYRIFNADGGEVEQCGNGARCFARFVREQGLTHKNPLVVETAAGNILLQTEPNNEITVDMGRPRFNPADIPFLADQEELIYSLKIAGQEIPCGVVSMGNPHCVIRVEKITDPKIIALGAIIESHERFPRRVNVGFMEIIQRDYLRLRVYERGAGETLACGSGACAAVAIGIRQGLLDSRVIVELPGGQLKINWRSESETILMTGPATTVFQGTIAL